MNYIKQLLNEFRINGVICERIQFCDNWAFENYMLENLFKDIGIPVLLLEREYLLTGAGQLKTRVRAFLEILEDEIS